MSYRSRCCREGSGEFRESIEPHDFNRGSGQYGYPRDHQPSPPDWTAEREAILDRWVAAGKLVLTIDYSSRPEQIEDAYQRSRARGYIPYVADRSLGRLRINPGFEPD